MTPTVVELAADYISSNLTEKRPLFVALQGPQGSGKSYVTAQLQKYFQSLSHTVAIISIDDLYLPHKDLVSLASAYPDNALWRGRGQPGTHDVSLGLSILSALKAGDTVELPRFDKSLHGGEGDRLPMVGSGTVVKQPPQLDIVILEGWCVGFNARSPEDVKTCWEQAWTSERAKLNLESDEICRLSDVEAVNERLKQYAALWDYFDIFIRLIPQAPASSSDSQYAVVYEWRLEQEHNMKSNNGGIGMSDTAVKSFVDRYIPGYVFFGNVDDESSTKASKWSGRGLSIYIDSQRNLVRTAAF